jgi:UDP-glucose 4-epimerase
VTRYFVTGGAGFLGSHLVKRLAARPSASVVVFDNFTSGRRAHLAGLPEGAVEVVEGDLKYERAVARAIAGCEHAYHLAANPDIARAAADPTVDFWEGTYLTQNLLEAARRAGVARVTYASGSGVYGDRGAVSVTEDMPPHPISPYGASKLGCEAMLAAYCHMFEMGGVALRFANVVGPNQTHGVAYDFIRRLRDDPAELVVQGDGSQTKSYIHVDDVVDAMLLLEDQGIHGFEVLNVATDDYVTVRDIADLVVERLGFTDVRYRFGREPRGWRGDVPVVRFDTTRVRARGWRNRRTSREALSDSIDAMISANQQ